MSRSSSEEISSEEWVLYRDRADWKDVTPLKQNDGPNPVVKIAYSDKFTDVYDYFRAVVKSGEKSHRVLALTADAIELNSANYTAWYYRREVLKSLGCDLKDELAYSRELIEDHPKNYQVWQHRRVLIEWLDDPGNELRLTEVILAADQKNYHAWQYRQWVLQTYKLWDNELNFVEDLLEDDIRNNSAWNQRFFVVSQSEGWSGVVCEREILFTLDKIKLVSRNESAWNYLRGVLEHCEDEDVRLKLRTKVSTFCEEMLKTCELKKSENSPYLLGFLVELKQEDLENSEGSPESGNSLAELESLCEKLANHCDTIRKKYWNHIASNARRKYGQA